ncbi:hypothetical protein K461DRAFT_320816 [Myriangium duriaei CBS 260.36]|uniref:Rieske domain-containing protein n=1 Tax=Myriangium duriaei CBS 260.36 TaxID=1168546 RepID=A0A9P4J644_9PEZI|nr:hypothetical protein K461DRAFT_320816 [Myriangium duriaei CBS 260.36]
MFAFLAPNRRGEAWFSVGLVSSFPDITESESDALSDTRPCRQERTQGCKVFKVPREDATLAGQVAASDIEDVAFTAQELRDQVLVFQYKGKIHAINNECPHSSYPLSEGAPFDIEDFGVVLSAGITCIKHGWSFDLFSGQGDRGYKLKLWETELRAVPGRAVDDEEREVWVRRKQKIG